LALPGHDGDGYDVWIYWLGAGNWMMEESRSRVEVENEKGGK